AAQRITCTAHHRLDRRRGLEDLSLHARSREDCRRRAHYRRTRRGAALPTTTGVMVNWGIWAFGYFDIDLIISNVAITRCSNAKIQASRTPWLRMTRK